MIASAARLSASAAAAAMGSKLCISAVPPASLAGATVLVRSDLNVPMDKKNKTKITDDTRIVESLPTLQLLRAAGAKVVVCSHLGRPDGKVVDTLRLAPVAQRLSELLGAPVATAPDCVGPAARDAAAALKPGGLLLLENVRFHEAEEENTTAFAESLVRDSGATVFVNDAFGTAHRAHASTAGVTAFVQKSCAGLLMDKELRYLVKAIESPTRPLAALVGGAKVSTKLPVLRSLISKVNVLAIGGAMAFTFWRAQGADTGRSLVEESQIPVAAEVLREAADKGVHVWLPSDVVAAAKPDDAAAAAVYAKGALPASLMGLDIGPDSLRSLNETLAACRTVFWNGPVGLFETRPFDAGTKGVALALAEQAKKGSVVIVGGGDTVSAVQTFKVASAMSHVSTGGGASLELIEGKLLPGVVRLTDATK